jgi:ABC-type transporter Mla subunit MlaD
MSEKASQFKIGVFVLAGLAILLAALFAFGLRSAFERMHHFETYVTGEVEGLSKGAAVKLRGVEVGKVTDVGFSWNIYPGASPNCVVIRFAIAESVSPIPVGSDIGPGLRGLIGNGLRAIVKTQAITGSSVVSLEYVDAAQNPPIQFNWKPKYYYVPAAPSQLGQILAGIERTVANLEKLDVAKIGASVDQTLRSADAALQKIQQLDVAGISKNVNKVATDASATVLEVKELASDARRTLASMRLDTLSSDGNRLVNNLDARLQVLLEKLDAIDVHALNDTLSGTREAARNLNDALEELKRHPSGFLFGAAPPPAAGLEKEKK